MVCRLWCCCMRVIVALALHGTILPLMPAHAQPVNEKDSLALVAFYNGTNGEHWSTRSQWLRGPVKLWYGISLTDNRVTELILPSNSIAGHIPPEIGDLEYLEKIDLQNNSLFSIPPEIGKLTRLRELDLQFNWQIRDSVPDEIVNLIHLEKLNLKKNRFNYLPDLTPLDPEAGGGSLRTVDVTENELTFEDIEPNYGLSFEFLYTPQSPVAARDLFQYDGDFLTLNHPVGGQYNRYQWFKDGVLLGGESNDQLEIGIPTRADQGIYELEIKNTLVTDLVLRSHEIDYKYTETYTVQWLDIGAYRHAYSQSGARHWASETPRGKEFPAIMRHASHNLSNAFWIGLKDWTDARGQHYPYYVARLGPNEQGAFYTYPIQNKLVGRYPDTVVEVNGEPSFDKEATLDEIDPGLPADRMLHNVNNMSMGITVDRKIYAYTNEYHDNYHLKVFTYCNTGNIDDDDEIELPDQTLHDVIFYSINRWTGSEQATYATESAQRWGRYTVHDVVGDGNEEYPVDFTAQYAWTGWTHNSLFRDYSDLGGPLLSDEAETVAAGDSIGRLAGATMMGQSVIHADRTATDSSYDPGQPAYMAWIDNDSNIYKGRDPVPYAGRATHEQLYELGIVAPVRFAGDAPCTDCRRTYPHMADFNQPNGLFWDIASMEFKLTGGFAGGFSSTTGYGPYEMGPGACIRIVESEGIAGLSFDAATKIGQAFKNGGIDRDTDIIAYDANSDGAIDPTPFDYDQVFVGTEAQTKDQWFLSARDSLFQAFYRARDLHEASRQMNVYPVPEPPRPPTRFSLRSQSRHIDLDWSPAPDGPAVSHWELYRTEHWVDNLYVNGCLEDPSVECGYERVATLPAGTTTYADAGISPGVDYFYYLQAVGEAQPDDHGAIHGTPGSVPLRSGRYLTQTYTPVRMISGVAAEDADLPGRFRLYGNYPNPFSNETRIRYELPTASEVELTVYDVLGRQTDVLVNAFQTAGRHEYVFSPTGLASGVYVYVLQAGDEKAEGKMLLRR